MDDADWRTRPVAGIGIVGLDHVAVTDKWERDTKSTASRYFEQVGGPVPVALMAMVRLGLDHPPMLQAFVGADEPGRTVRAFLRDAGVDNGKVRRVPSEVTAHSLVVLNTADGTRSLTSFPGRGLTPLETEACRLPLDMGLLHTDGRYLTLTRSAALNLREFYGGVASLDLGSWRETYSEHVLNCFDIVIASRTGGAGACPNYRNDPVAQTKTLLAWGATVAGVTLGADGVVIGCRDENGGEPVHLPAFRVPNVVDTCGAGDLFHGAFLWAYRAGESVIESATFAQAAVALRIQHYGNVAGQPTREQVEAFLANR